MAEGTETIIQHHAARLNELLKAAEKQGIIIGAQLATGFVDSEPVLNTIGKLAPNNPNQVNEETQFCIASCSKPFASVCILTLVDQGTVDLDTPVNRWVKGLDNLKVKTLRTRAPTIRELLAHRGGIYSQKQGRMTVPQARAIRDFSISLEESVEIIMEQPLLAVPGEKYAYSGAGYCLAGYVAEQAMQKGFDEIFRANVAEPLEMRRTTYFPSPKESNIAVPGKKTKNGRIVAQDGAPHLLRSQLKLPLIGGSLYSTTKDTALFAQLMLQKGRIDKQRIMSPNSWKEISRQQFAGQGYGLGWGLQIKRGKCTALSHQGALLGYRSLIRINLKQQHFTIVYWTVSDPKHSALAKFQKRLEKYAFSEL